MTTIIFKCSHGEIGKHELDYYSIGAGHLLCVELAKEIERLRSELSKPQSFVEPITGPG